MHDAMNAAHIPTQRSGDDSSCYQLIGGAPVVRDVVERFYTLIMDDDELRPYFDGVEIEKVKRHQVALLTQMLNGPQHYHGRDMTEAHRGLGITAAHYRKVTNLLTGVLWTAGVTEDIVTAVGIALATVQPEVVEAPDQQQAVEFPPDWA